MNDESKKDIYERVIKEIPAILEDETNNIARMATISCVLKHNFPHFYWCGFYMVDQNKSDELVVGPYQGTLGCLRIKKGRGVCGTAFAENKTQIVKNVHEIENHITCDPKSMSEIVIPVTSKGSIIAVLDIDSDIEDSFSSIDQEYLERIIETSF